MEISPESVASAEHILQRLYLIHGEEDLLRIEALDALRRRAAEQGFLLREVLTADAHFDWNDMFYALNSMGLFADKKLIEIHIPSGKPGKNGGDALCRLPENLNDDCSVIIFLPKLESAQTKSKWFSALNAHAEVINAKAVDIAQLPLWIKRRLAQNNLDIEADALDVFAQRVEGNLLAARQEIEKLALTHNSSEKINLQEAQEAVAQVARFDVFQLAQSWMNGDFPRLQRLLDGLQADGEEPILLLWAVSEDIRTLIRLQAAFKQGQSVVQVRNVLRLWGDKQNYASRAAKRISTQRLMQALQQCAVADKQIKGAAEGSAWQTVRELLGSLAR